MSLVRRVIFAVVIGACPARLTAQQPSPAGWQLVYAVDSVGQRSFGEKERLLTAVRSGQPVRVGFGVSWRLADGTPGGVEHVADAAFVSIYRDEVFAQLAPIMGQTPAAREPTISFRTQETGLWYALLDTTGRLQGYFAGGAKPQITRVATYWYVAGLGADSPKRLY